MENNFILQKTTYSSQKFLIWNCFECSISRTKSFSENFCRIFVRFPLKRLISVTAWLPIKLFTANMVEFT